MAHDKYFLRQIQDTQQLLARIFRTVVAILGKRESRAGDGTLIRIADQRQNWVIERRSGNLNPSAFGGIGVRGQNFGEEFALTLQHEFLVVERVVALLAD